MLKKANKTNRHFVFGLILTGITALYLIINSFIVGRNEFFLLLNGDLGNFADNFFAFWTNLGDGVMWVIVAYLFFRYRKKQFPLLVATIIISTLITQVTKHYIAADIARPTAAIADSKSIHTVPGVELLTANSFPSGHTATAFCFFLLGCLLINKRWIIPVGFLFALLVGYSRIYLAQHFPLDVGAGMVTAMITVWLSILIQKRWRRRKQLH
jgi:membrane-associated phospholipid phosphatase